MTIDSPAPPPMLAFVRDPANAMTLAGLCCAGGSLYWSGAGNRTAAALAMVWACGFDWFDGAVARATRGRAPLVSQFGAHLDSLADIVSGAACPAALLWAAWGYAAWAVPGTLVLLCAGAIRLAYFNVFGAPGGCHVGLSIDKNIIVVAAAYLTEPVLRPDVFRLLLYAAVVAVALLNVSPLRIPKLTGRWYYVYAAVWAGFTVAFGSRLV